MVTRIYVLLVGVRQAPFAPPRPTILGGGGGKHGTARRGRGTHPAVLLRPSAVTVSSHHHHLCGDSWLAPTEWALGDAVLVTGDVTRSAAFTLRLKLLLALVRLLGRLMEPPPGVPAPAPAAGAVQRAGSDCECECDRHGSECDRDGLPTYIHVYVHQPQWVQALIRRAARVQTTPDTTRISNRTSERSIHVRHKPARHAGGVTCPGMAGTHGRQARTGNRHTPGSSFVMQHA